MNILSDSFNTDARLSSKLQWDKTTQSYRVGKRKINDRQLYKIVRKEVAIVEQKAEKLAIRLANGDLSFEQWQDQMTELVKRSHIKMTRLGRGGGNNTFAYNYLVAGNDLRTIHYPALRQFAKDIAEGKLSEKQIIARAKLYGSATKNSFEVARLSLYDQPEVLARRRLGVCKDHCSDCLRYASQGWISISSIIPPGERCQCKMNCCCSIEIKKGN